MLFPKHISPKVRNILFFVALGLVAFGLMVKFADAMIGAPEPVDDAATMETELDTPEQANEGSVNQTVKITNTVNDDESELDSEDEIDNPDIEIEDNDEVVQDSSVETTTGNSNINISVHNGDYDIHVDGEGEVTKEVEQTDDSTKIHVEYKEETKNSSVKTSVKINQSSR